MVLQLGVLSQLCPVLPQHVTDCASQNKFLVPKAGFKPGSAHEGRNQRDHVSVPLTPPTQLSGNNHISFIAPDSPGSPWCPPSFCPNPLYPSSMVAAAQLSHAPHCSPAFSPSCFQYSCPEKFLTEQIN